MVDFKRSDELGAQGTKPLRAEDVLKTALDVIEQREQQHGTKRAVFDATRRLWSAYLGIPVTAEQVAQMMVLLKIARSQNGSFNPDDHIDAVGYAALAGEMRGAT
jgi:hypothetical protein